MAVTLTGIDALPLATAGPATPAGTLGSSAAASAAASSAAASAADAQGSAPAGGEVEFTARATRLAELERSLTSGSPVSDAKVETISRALASGRYSIDPAKIAGGLLQSEQLLGQLPAQDA